MTEFGKIVIAAALSVLAHVGLFTALTLMPGNVLVPAVDSTAEEIPLEVSFESAPATVEPVLAQAESIRTQLDPANLKKADQAPEQPREIAAHNSQATPPKPDFTAGMELAAAPAPSPQPETDEVGIDALGNYGKAVGNAIGVRWEFYRRAQKDLPVGEVRIKFSIDAQGHPSAVKVLSNTAAPANAQIAMRAVQEAKIPPIPSERLAQVPNGRMEITYLFINYRTQ